MKLVTRHTRLILALGLAAVCGLFGGTELFAQKKPGGGGGAVPPGRIYYTWLFDGDISDRSMKADGSDKQPTFTPGVPSYRLHEGHRWYLTVEDNWPNGFALLAVRDDGDPDSTVLLLALDEIGVGTWDLRWGKDDSFIAFGGYRVDENGNLIDGTDNEIWAAELAFDDLTGQPALAEAPVSIVRHSMENGVVRKFDLSPLGDRVAYQLDSFAGSSSNVLFIKDLISGVTDVLAGPGYNDNPVWSPDGARIAFNDDSSIYVINPDGTGLLQLTNPSNARDLMSDWSPESAHLSFTRVSQKRVKGVNTYVGSVMRLSATGGSAVNLTNDIGGSSSAKFWR